MLVEFFLFFFLLNPDFNIEVTKTLRPFCKLHIKLPYSDENERAPNIGANMDFSDSRCLSFKTWSVN